MGTGRRDPGKVIAMDAGATIPDGAVVVIGAADNAAALPAGASPTAVMCLGLAKREGGGSYSSGDKMDVVVSGTYAGIAGGSITRGDKVTSGGTDGSLITAAPAGGANCTFVGIALATAASGDRFVVLVCPGIMQGA